MLAGAATWPRSTQPPWPSSLRRLTEIIADRRTYVEIIA